MASKKQRKPAPKITIAPSKQGSLRRIAGTPAGQPIPVAKLRALAKSSDPAVAKKAQFALNARSFTHKRKHS